MRSKITGYLIPGRVGFESDQSSVPGLVFGMVSITTLERVLDSVRVRVECGLQDLTQEVADASTRRSGL